MQRTASVHTLNLYVTRVQSATEWTPSVHTLHMSKKHCYEPDNLHTWSTQNKQVRLLKTCTWQPARMEHTKYTAVRTQVYIQQNHFACTDEALGRVYRWGPWPRVQTRPLPLRPWPEPSACTCEPGPEPSACTCDPRKRVHSRPPDLLSTTTFLLSKTFLLSQFSPPLQHAFNYIPFIKNIPFIKIFPPLCSPCFQLQHSFYQKHSFYHNFPPLCSPCFQLHVFYQKHSFYQNFSPPLQPMLSTTTFLLSNTFLLSQFSPTLCSPCFQLHSFYQKHSFYQNFPPLCSPCFQWFRLPGVICDLTWLPFIKIFPPLCSPCFQLQHSFYQTHSFYHNFPPLCSPCFQLHSFYQTHSFYHNFPPPLQPMLSTTTFLLSNTFLLSQFSPPLQPMLSMIQVTRGHLRPYLTSIYQNFSPLCSPCFQLQHSFYQKHSFYHNFPPLCSPCFQLHSFYQKHSFYQNFPPSAAHALKIDCSKNNCPWPYTFEAGQRPCQANIIKCLLKKHILRITWSELLCGVVVACDPTHKRPGGPSRRQGLSHLRLFQGGG